MNTHVHHETHGHHEKDTHHLFDLLLVIQSIKVVTDVITNAIIPIEKPANRPGCPISAHS